MWKSVSFQQVFRLFAQGPPLWKTLHTPVHKVHNTGCRACYVNTVATGSGG